LCMRIVATSLVIVLVINGISILANKPKRDPPVPADRYGPGTLSVTFERMKVSSRKCHIPWGGCSTQTTQYEAKPFSVFGVDA